MYFVPEAPSLLRNMKQVTNGSMPRFSMYCTWKL